MIAMNKRARDDYQVGEGGGRKKNIASLIQSYKIYTKRQLKRVKWKLVYLIGNKPIKYGCFEIL